MYSIIHVLESITSANPHSKESFFQTYKYLIHTKLSKLYCVLFSPPDFEYWVQHLTTINCSKINQIISFALHLLSWLVKKKTRTKVCNQLEQTCCSSPNQVATRRTQPSTQPPLPVTQIHGVTPFSHPLHNHHPPLPRLHLSFPPPARGKTHLGTWRRWICVCFLFSFVSSRNLHYDDQGRVNTFLHGLEENHYVKERAIKLLKSLKYFQHRSSLSCWSELGVVYSLGELFI